MDDEALGESIAVEILAVRDGRAESRERIVATEVPCTIVANGREVVTILATPARLRELAVGHLFTAGLVRSVSEVKGFSCDERLWRLDVELERDIDPDRLGKRLYTSGCGKGVMYASVVEIASRQPLPPGLEVRAADLETCMKKLLSGSSLFRKTRGVHSAALARDGALLDPIVDDIGRHNAVDKVIGHGLLNGADFSRSVLIATGRTSSEIVFKARRAGIPVVVSRGAPTHQAVLLARDMGMTVASYRAGETAVYSGRERVMVD